MCKVKSMPVLPTSIVTRLFYGLSLLLTLPTGKKRYFTEIYCVVKCVDLGLTNGIYSYKWQSITQYSVILNY